MYEITGTLYLLTKAKEPLEEIQNFNILAENPKQAQKRVESHLFQTSLSTFDFEKVPPITWSNLNSYYRPSEIERDKETFDKLVEYGYAIHHPPDTSYTSQKYYLTKKGKAFADQARREIAIKRYNKLSNEAKDTLSKFQVYTLIKQETLEDIEDAVAELQFHELVEEEVEESWDSYWWFYKITRIGRLALQYKEEKC